MNFFILGDKQYVPSSGHNVAYLKRDNWNDYSFVTMFYLTLYDEYGKCHEIGNVKIGFKGQTTTQSTHTTISSPFQTLPETYFSLGLGAEYYHTISTELSDTSAVSIFTALNDIAYNDKYLDVAINEEVFSTSLLRDVSMAAIKGQFRRILTGGAPLTDFKFTYERPDEEKLGGVSLEFRVKATSTPSTNIHAIIGRNGVGKTTLLNGMIEGLTQGDDASGAFYDDENWQPEPIDNEYFSSLVSVSFSAFDPFDPPADQPDPTLGTCYYYIGLKDPSDEFSDALKSLPVLHKDFIKNLAQCLSQKDKKKRWLKAITSLESDENFAAMNLRSFADLPSKEVKVIARKIIKRMSSGHAIVLITMTKLVATVEEKTLVLIDEAESHLHPPLLSAFTRALSELLHDRNGVALIATHSPVVLQEIPKSCVWKITRSGLSVSTSRPEIETFGENVGVLTREVFGLEVAKSGFHQLLADAVATGDTYETIIYNYGNQLGFEGQAILKSMIFQRDQSNFEQ
ncbi:conserved hypothetical protein [Candidatus Terasakiella magnetica]|uniref:ATPase AAA-type core domain-containing protein n=1 Tax=Candidatus Terasakiella magnetica TaxID=1867952 RepID=A0A1C3RHK2_9PROT|nr:AAA family ATPase [Candidatus Terasakiella magnetica]SCA56749.1 conserved hypothetical protein [Candidatus Terasakiella magnetica]